MPSLKTAIPDSAGPVCVLEQRFIVKEQPTVNLGANGTGLTCEQIAVNLAQTFQLFFLGGPMQGFYAAPAFYKYVEGNSDKPFVAIQVVLNATFVLTPLQPTTGPAAAAAEQTVTLTDQQPGGGSVIYYTTDGSFPGGGNPAAIQYSTPFTVSSGTVVRTASYKAPLQGSMVDTFTVI
jgi:hypothetical protein